MRVLDVLQGWSHSFYEAYLAYPKSWAKLNIPKPKDRRFLFEEPASMGQIAELEERFSVHLPTDVADFYKASNGWSFSLVRGMVGRFLPVSEVDRLRTRDPLSGRNLVEVLTELDMPGHGQGYFLLTDNPMGSEMVIAACDFSFFLVDPFLGDLESRNSFLSVLIEYRDLYERELIETLRIESESS